MLRLFFRALIVVAVVSWVTVKLMIDDSVKDRVERPLTPAELLQNARDIMKRFDAEYKKMKNRRVLNTWNEMSSINENVATKENVSPVDGNLFYQIVIEAIAFPWKDLEDEYVKRQFKKFTHIFPEEYDENIDQEAHTHGYKFDKFQSIISQMEKICNTAKICDYKNKTKCDLALVPEISEIRTHSRDPEELKHIWVEWSRATGEQVKTLYPKYAQYANFAARYKNFPDHAAYWMRRYETDDLFKQIETLWQQVKPLYLQLHAYVRRELKKTFGENKVSKDGPVPVHLWGNMWGRRYLIIANLTAPFPDKQMPDVTTALLEQGYNATGIFRLAENFFKSINLSAMPDTFWEKSILTKPNTVGVDMDCIGRAWDFYDGKDFRISHCTTIDMESLFTAYHEMGHIEYMMQYKDQPTLFKEAANPGFHEGVADAFSLSVSPGYFKKIGLLKDDSKDPGESINYLYLMSLTKIVLLPFTYMADKWRWNVFKKKVTPDNYNCHWWSLAEEHQGIEPPVDRSEEDFDPGALHHIIADVEYIRYFVGFVVQFQFHKALCIKAKQYDPKNPSTNPLHKCDIYRNKDAGNLLKSMMELGSSKPWPDAMEKITGQRQMDAAALLEYFQPLMDWLTKENKRTNELIGWKPSNKRCVKTRKELIDGKGEL